MIPGMNDTASRVALRFYTSGRTDMRLPDDVEVLAQMIREAYTPVAPQPVRICRHKVGDLVAVPGGKTGRIVEVFLDPISEPTRTGPYHARYTVSVTVSKTVSDPSPRLHIVQIRHYFETRWDWELQPAG
jgi:hypothetical protein